MNILHSEENGFILKTDEKWKYGVYSKNKVLVEHIYDMIYVDETSKGIFFRVRLGNKWGVFNIHGENIIPTIYDEIWTPLYENEVYNVIQLDSYGYNKYGLINYEGKVILNCEYGYITPVRKNGSAYFSVKKKYGLINVKTGFISPLIYDSVSYNDKIGIWGVILNGECGYIDKQGELYTYDSPDDWIL